MPAEFRLSHKPYYMDLTDTYPGGEEAWQKDRAKMNAWTELRFKEQLEADNPSFWTSIAVSISDKKFGNPLLQEFHNEFRRFNDWLSKLLFMNPAARKTLWMALIIGTRDLNEAATGPHTDFPSTPADPKFPQTEYWNGCRFILPIREYEDESRSTQWWDLKERDKYILGSREHVNAIRAKQGGFLDNAPDSRYASVIQEQFLHEFEIVSVQRLRGPAIINSALPHFPVGAVLKDNEPYRVVYTLKPARPEITHCMLMGQKFQGRELYG